MADKTGICNMSISHLAVSKEIANVETERSAEASACRRFYQPALDEALRDFPNPYLTVIEPLALVEEDPNDEWAYSYRYPSDCSKAIRILSGIRNDSPDTRVPYRIIKDDQGALILTDKEDAELEYVQESTDPNVWAADFVMAFSLLLAFYIAPRVTAGDPFKLGERAYRAYILSIAKSRANAVGEQQDEPPPESDSIRARD